MRHTLESAMLELYEEKVQSEGCEFLLDPEPARLPNELAGLQPDALVLCPSEKRVVIARSLHQDTTELVTKYQQALSGNNEWRFVILWTDEFNEALDYVDAKVADILKSVEALDGIPADLPDARLLALFAIFERVARIYAPLSRRASVSSISLIEAIASVGVITPTQADQLRKLTRKRNALNHGARADPIMPEDFQLLGEVIVDVGKAIMNDVHETKEELAILLTELMEEDSIKNGIAVKKHQKKKVLRK